MRKKVHFIICAIVFSTILPIHIVSASQFDTDKNTTDFGIEFEKKTDIITDEPSKSPTIDNGGDLGTQLLPKTGEMITSMIIILIGISIVVFLMGLVILKNIYVEVNWGHQT